MPVMVVATSGRPHNRTTPLTSSHVDGGAVVMPEHELDRQRLSSTETDYQVKPELRSTMIGRQHL
jgi:hypothetical protein